MGSFDNKDYVCLLGYLNARVGNGSVKRIVGHFGRRLKWKWDRIGWNECSKYMVLKVYLGKWDEWGEETFGLCVFLWKGRSKLLDINVLRKAVMGL